MKVIRSYSDYYDGILANFAHESTPFYNRQAIRVDKLEYNELQQNLPRTQVVSVIPLNDDKKEYNHRHSYQVDLDMGVIGFCGKLYVVFYEMSVFDKDKPIQAYDSTQILSDRFLAGVKHSWYKNDYKIKNDKNEIQLIVDTWKNEKMLLELFVKYKVPSFFYSHKGLTLNPCLKDFNMQTVIHPYTAVQELEMFLNNTLCDVSTPPMPVGDDKTIAESKGYDKWSFRKMPDPKKKK